MAVGAMMAAVSSGTLAVQASRAPKVPPSRPVVVATPKAMWAEIGPDGSVLRNSRVTRAARSKKGVYVVDFDQDVSQCAFLATPEWFASFYSTPVQGSSVLLQMRTNGVTRILTCCLHPLPGCWS
jgi:hypothetical protein